MSLIQANQKLLHITIALLIYGVRLESTAPCPGACQCVETVAPPGPPGPPAATTSGPTTPPQRILTYQITCNRVRDLQPAWLERLPAATTQLIIQEAFFQSLKTFHQMLRETSTKLNKLSDLSVTGCVIYQKTTGATHGSGPRPEFLPFASLQSPRLRQARPLAAPQLHLLILNLSNNTLVSLPPDMFRQFPGLQTLDLSNNQLESLDDDHFAALGSLLRLDLHGNRIRTIGNVVFRSLGKLLALDVSHNAIHDIAPSAFQSLTSLNTLILADNPLPPKQEALVLLGTGKRLQTVDASRTGLKQVPATLERSVRRLSLQGNMLTSVQCGDLDSYSLLTFLDLRVNKISYIEEDALGRLELLVQLYVTSNNLFQVPKSLPNKLEVLNLSFNNIQNITAVDFVNLSSLKELSLSSNQINSIEEGSFDALNQLLLLDLSHNPILTLPRIAGLPNLTDLNLSYFTNIPNGFQPRPGQFPTQSPHRIRSLNLESSPFMSRLFLQDTKTLQQFSSLEELCLRFSNLTALRKDIFTLAPRLRTLRLEGNPWHCSSSDLVVVAAWLRLHDTAPRAQQDDMYTAHCATPASLYKTPIAALSGKRIEDGPSKLHWRPDSNAIEDSDKKVVGAGTNASKGVKADGVASLRKSGRTRAATLQDSAGLAQDCSQHRAGGVAATAGPTQGTTDIAGTARPSPTKQGRDEEPSEAARHQHSGDPGPGAQGAKTHPGMYVLLFIAVVMGLALVLALGLHRAARARRRRRHRPRSSHSSHSTQGGPDIEVCSISSELW